MEKNAKIYVAGHHGLVGSAIWKNLQDKGYTNLIGRTHQELDLLDGVAVRRFFDEEQPEYVFLAAAFVGGIMANSIYRADFIYKNLQIQQNVIGESFRHNVRKLLFLGTRRFVWSEDNPYFFKGKAGEGIGGPHIGYDMVWPMSIMMKAFTSQDDQEIKECIKMLINTDAGTGFMHESFHKDDPANFTRAWFAWQNTLFGELILKLVNEGKLELLNNIK